MTGVHHEKPKKMMKTYLKTPRLVLVLLLTVFSLSGSAQSNVYQLFRNSYKVIESQRLPNGMYRDSKVVRPGWTDFHPISVANVGVGLVSLSIAHRAGFEPDAEALAIQTLKTILGETSGFTPDRNVSGYYRHFIDIETGARAWDSEYSTIDAAILVSGALFAKEYFCWNSTIAAYADRLFNSIDWSRSIYRASTGEVYLEMGADGYGMGGVTRPFNEYMIVVHLAMLADRGSNGIGTQAWNTWTNLDQFATANYWGYQLLTDSPTGEAFLSDFTIQFPYYYVNWATRNGTYINYMRNAMNADRRYYRNISDLYPARQPNEWGLGAGSNDGGYHADAINNHPQRIVSPHIMGGFLPLDRTIRRDLRTMLSQNKGNYTLPDGTPLIWRYSLDNPDWRANDVQGIDYSTMLYGLAHSYLGSNFFRTYNNFTIPSPGAGITESNDGDLVQLNDMHTSSNPTQRVVTTDFTVDDMHIYPNPAQRMVTTEFTRDEPGSFKIEILDMAGKTVLVNSEANQSAGVHTWIEDVTSLPVGEYVIEYSIGGKIRSRRLSKKN